MAQRQSKLDAFLQIVTDTVPFLIEMRVVHVAPLKTELSLLCLDDFTFRQVYSPEEIENVPHAILCDYLIHTIRNVRGEHGKAVWQAMKPDAAHGIALCRLGEWSMQRSIDWPPPQFLQISWPRIEKLSLPAKLSLRQQYDTTRVALYEG